MSRVANTIVAMVMTRYILVRILIYQPIRVTIPIFSVYQALIPVDGRDQKDPSLSRIRLSLCVLS